MPLHEGKSKKVIGENIREMEASGHPHDQAVAASLHNAHPNGGKNMADGGEVEPKPVVEDSTLQGLANLMKKIRAQRDSVGEANAIDVDKPQDAPKTDEPATPPTPMADGGEVKPDVNEPGLQDATANDFLLPFLLGPAMKAGAVDEAIPALEGLGEKGAISLGAAPKMEEAAGEEAAPKIEAFVKGIQKGKNGDVKIWGVKGPPELLKQHFGDEAPASVPENVLRDKGFLPQQVSSPQNAPNAYAEGGTVQPMPSTQDGKPTLQQILAMIQAQKAATGAPMNPELPSTQVPPPVDPAAMAAMQQKGLGMSKGGTPAPHVTFMENETPETVKKVTHLEAMPKMAKGGMPMKKPDMKELSHEAKTKEIYKAMGIKKYADGGAVPGEGLPTDLPATPNPSDPTYWDQIKAALSKVTSPMSGAASAIAAPAEAAGSAALPLIPPAMSAVNKLTGADLPVPPTAPPAGAGSPPLIPPTAISPAPATPPILPPVGAGAGPSTSTSDMPNLKTIFNQDTSKLTAGVNPEDRQALANKLQDTQHGIGAVIAQAMSGLGDALAAKGGRDQHSLQGIFSMQKTQRDEALANFDKARQDRIEKLQMQTQMGDNALKQAAAADAYGVDEHLNGLIGAPKGTMKKDLNTYFQIMSAQVAKQEKDADLYMKAHAQAGGDVDNAVKNASVLGIKPSASQLQASGQKLADQYYNRAKGNVLVKPSDGGPAQWIPAQNISKAKQMDPSLQVMP